MPVSGFTALRFTERSRRTRIHENRLYAEREEAESKESILKLPPGKSGLKGEKKS